jgi:hypothetical protein
MTSIPKTSGLILREKSAGAAGCRERRTRGDAARRESEPTQEEVERTVSFDCYRSPCF